MNDHARYADIYGRTLVIRPSRKKTVLIVALIGLWTLAPIFALLQPGPHPLVLMVLLFQLCLLMMFYLGIRRQEVWISTSMLTVYSMVGKRVIPACDLRYMKMRLFRILTVAYEDDGQTRKAKIRCNLMSFGDEQRLLSAFRELYPEIPIE